jgi:hypothetical protein
MGIFKTIEMDIKGLGIIFYSEDSVKHIKQGDNYLKNNYWDDIDVLEHIFDGSIVGFCTGSPGQYILEVTICSKEELCISGYDYVMKLGIQVSQNKIYFKDLYDLMDWDNDCADEYTFKIENGFYEVNILSNLPKTKINMFFIRSEKMPQLHYSAIPTLWNEEDL